MKSLSLLILAVIVGVVAGVGIFELKPKVGEGIEKLSLRVLELENEVNAMRDFPPALPTHNHWTRLEQHLDMYENLKLDHLPSEQVGHPNLGGDQWGGVMSGPTLDLMIAARIVKNLVPVYFDRVAVKDDAARISFYVLGSKGD